VRREDLDDVRVQERADRLHGGALLLARGLPAVVRREDAVEGLHPALEEEHALLARVLPARRLGRQGLLELEVLALHAREDGVDLVGEIGVRKRNSAAYKDSPYITGAMLTAPTWFSSTSVALPFASRNSSSPSSSDFSSAARLSSRRPICASVVFRAWEGKSPS
jgi:hypothetical protein